MDPLLLAFSGKSVIVSTDTAPVAMLTVPLQDIDAATVVGQSLICVNVRFTDPATTNP